MRKHICITQLNLNFLKKTKFTQKTSFYWKLIENWSNSAEINKYFQIWRKNPANSVILWKIHMKMALWNCSKLFGTRFFLNSTNVDLTYLFRWSGNPDQCLQCLVCVTAVVRRGQEELHNLSKEVYPSQLCSEPIDVLQWYKA